MILVLLVVSISCKDKKYSLKLIDMFPTTEHLKGKPIENITLFSKGNVNLISIDSFLVIQKSEEPFFRIYSTNDYKLLSEFGKEGKGPNEFIYPELLNQTSYDKSNNSPIICVYDYTRRNFTRINILNLVKNQTDQIYNNIPIPMYDQYFTYFFFRDDNLLIATPEREWRFVIYKDTVQSFVNVPYLPSVDFSVGEELKAIVYRSASYVNKKIGVMASAPLLLGEIDFFNLEGQYLSSSVFSSRKILKYDLENIDKIRGNNPKYFIEEIHANDNYIYALNYDNYQNDFYVTGNYTNQSILVFDWEGIPIKKYILDKQHFIKSFAIDWKNNRIYGYDSNELNNTIIVYQVKEDLYK
jgi:hypothetical protein